jgi:hypothetical protein
LLELSQTNKQHSNVSPAVDAAAKQNLKQAADSQATGNRNIGLTTVGQ